MRACGWQWHDLKSTWEFNLAAFNLAAFNKSQTWLANPNSYIPTGRSGKPLSITEWLLPTRLLTVRPAQCCTKGLLHALPQTAERAAAASTITPCNATLTPSPATLLTPSLDTYLNQGPSTKPSLSADFQDAVLNCLKTLRMLSREGAKYPRSLPLYLRLHSYPAC